MCIQNQSRRQQNRTLTLFKDDEEIRITMLSCAFMINFEQSPNFATVFLPSRRLLVPSQQWKYQDNVWNMFKVDNKNTGTASLTYCSGVSIVDFE